MLPRTTLIASLAVGALVSSLLIAGPAHAANSPSPTPTPTPTATPTPTPTPTPGLAVPSAPFITKVTPGVASGALAVLFAAPTYNGGSLISHYEVTVDGGLTWWPCYPTSSICMVTNLSNDRAYTIQLRAVNAVGPGEPSAPATGVPIIPPGFDPDKPTKLPKPRVWVKAAFDAASNHLGMGLGASGADEKLGVGTLPQLSFTRAIPDKRVVETHLFVTSIDKTGRVRQVKGAWGWLSDSKTVFRPVKYWPGRATISIRSTLDRAVMGKSGGKYVVGSDDLATTYTFQTARKLIIKVDGSTDRMKVYLDGKKIKDFGVSLGKAEWETRNGVKVISTLKEPLHTYTSTSLNLDPAVEKPYELKDIPWNTRLTPTGEFIHAAPWAYGRIGRYNGSHGCTNMFESDAKWIYDKTIPGDVVLYVNTGGPDVQSWNGPGGLWNIPWDVWLEKSALGSSNGKPNTANSASGSVGPSVGA